MKKLLLISLFLICSTQSFAQDAGEGEGCIECKIEHYRIETVSYPKDGETKDELEERAKLKHEELENEIKKNIEKKYEKKNGFFTKFDDISTKQYCTDLFPEQAEKGKCKLDSDPITGEEASGVCQFSYETLGEALRYGHLFSEISTAGNKKKFLYETWISCSRECVEEE
ncbi:MAG: hypothetical protein KC478_17135 [Bacteriovoracaceae bacterium]|nr:hypothetical protein [Bacteriovoracaceae bacterium]